MNLLLVCVGTVSSIALGKVIPFLLPDVGEGIATVIVKEWYAQCCPLHIMLLYVEYRHVLDALSYTLILIIDSVAFIVLAFTTRVFYSYCFAFFLSVFSSC